MKGAVGHFGAQAAREAAVRLEQMARSEELKGVPERLAALETAMEALRQELEKLAAGRSAAKRGK